MSTAARWLTRHPGIDNGINALFLMIVEHALKAKYRRS